MRNIGLILAIAFCTCAVAAPGLLSRKKRVSGYDNAGIEKDKSNEYESDYEYDDGEFFTCSSGDGERVELFLMCDGYRDCDDGSDEVPSKCEENGVTLLDTLPTTIPTTPEVTTAPTSEPVKPEIIEIGDYDDYVDACTEEEFQCSSDISICLPKFQVCDGVSDCPENEDEEKCHGDHQFDKNATANRITAEGLQPTETKVSYSGADLCASIDTFQCRSRPGDCVPRQLLCDGFSDCPDGSDEERCGCGFGKYMCVNGRCLDASVRCNGKNDCGDFSDEIVGCVLFHRISAKKKIAQSTEAVTTTRKHSTQTTDQTFAAPTAPDVMESFTSAPTATTHSPPSVDAGICSLHPCANGGECSENGASFVCVCNQEYTGPTCLQRARARGGSSASTAHNFNFLLYFCILIASCLLV